MTWFKDGLQFECTQCGKCCTGKPGYVWIKIEDMHRIAEFLGIRFREFVSKYVRKVGNRWSLIEEENSDCVFYESGCKIYPVRPVQCRTFPFWPENLRKPASWKEAGKECEGINQGKTYSAEDIDALLLEDHRSDF
jgi:Fe-S-cluster containining protein